MQKYNYFNQMPMNVNVEYDSSNTINIQLVGNSSSGKSCLINRYLGEKRAFVSGTSKTLIYNAYNHKYLPLKFYDSIGFEIGNSQQNNDLKNIVESYESYLKTKDTIHIVYFMISHDKLNDIELGFINFIMNKKIPIFMIANKFKEEDYDTLREDFTVSINGYVNFDQKKKDYLINHLYFVDLFADKCKELSKILRDTSKEFLESKCINEKIISKFENYQQRILNQETPPVEKDNLLNKDKNNNILINIDPEKNNEIKNEEELKKLYTEYIELCKKSKFLKENIKEYKEYKRKEALEIIDSYKISNFGLGMVPIPLLDKKLTKGSRLRMINQILEIYSPAFQLVKKNNKEMSKIYENEEQLLRALLNGLGDFTLAAGIGCEVAATSLRAIFNFFKCIPKFASGAVGGIVTVIISLATGYQSYRDVEKLGNQIIDFLEKKLNELNIFDIYYDSAKKYNKAISQLDKFAAFFDDSHEIKYDCDIDPLFDDEVAPEPIRP